MIAALRRRHRRWTLALAIAVPPLFAASLALRPVAPIAASLPAPLVAEPPVGAALLEADDLWAPLAVSTRLFAAPPGASGFVLELAPRVDPLQPDLLVYWSPSGADGEGLPPGAVLVGRLAGTERRRFALPPGAVRGSLHLYSLGHAQLVASAALPEEP